LITRLSGYLGPAMAEYTLGMVISLERRFFEYQHHQAQRNWADQGAVYRPLNTLTLGILGATGDIGSQVAQKAKAFGMKVHGLGRSQREEHFPNVDVVHFGKDSLPKFLSEVDYFVNCLPSTKDTVGLLSGEVLKHCAKKPSFINIGRFVWLGCFAARSWFLTHLLACTRGDVIDEDSIIKALDSGWVKTVVADVTAKEPLPETSPLWARKYEEPSFTQPHVNSHVTHSLAALGMLLSRPMLRR